jgi:hypothetical protein
VQDSGRKINQFLVQYARMQVGDPADGLMAEQPVGTDHARLVPAVRR